MRDFRVPTSLDEPKKAFLWDFDVFFIFIMGMGLGIVTKHIIISLLISLFLSWRWSKLKSGKHQWYFLHILYWYLPIDEKNKRIPKTNVQELYK